MLRALTTDTKQNDAARAAAEPEPQRTLHPRYADLSGAKLTLPLGIPPGAGKMSQRVAGLQRAVGNQAILRMLSQVRPTIQNKLTINQPGDQYEQEADRVVEQVMRMPDADFAANVRSTSSDGPKVQRKCACGGSGDECEACKEKQEKEEEGLLQRTTAATPVAHATAPPIVHEVLRSPGQPLDAATRAFFEPRFGRDFSRVRVHADAQAAQSAAAVNSLAYTVGHDVAFASGQYGAGTREGNRVLAHELAHVVQQEVRLAPVSVQRDTPKSKPADKHEEHQLPGLEECEGRVDITEDMRDFVRDLPHLMRHNPAISADQQRIFKQAFDKFFSTEAGFSVANYATVKCDKINLPQLGMGETFDAYIDSEKHEIGLKTDKADLIYDFRKDKNPDQLTSLLETLFHEKRHRTLGRSLEVPTSALKPGRDVSAALNAEYRSQEILATAEELAVGRLTTGQLFRVEDEVQLKIFRQWNMVLGWVTEQEAARLRGVIISKLRERYPSGKANCDSAMTIGVVTAMERGQWFACDPTTGHAIGRIPAGLNNCTDADVTVCHKEPQEKEPNTLQRRALSGDGPSTTPPIVHEVLRSPGQPLDTAARAFFEPRFGADFSRVRVHTDSKAARSAVQLGAAAYTCGNDIVFATGKYAPGAISGHHLLGHELAHVIQQRGTQIQHRPFTETTASTAEQQAEQTADAMWWGTLTPRYKEVASHIVAGSAKPPRGILSSSAVPSASFIQRVKLTYDDGPDTAGNTRVILNELNAAGARATFYLVGKRVAQGDNWRVVFDIAAAGHFLGNHAFDWNDEADEHIWLSGTPDERAVKILHTELVIRAALIRGKNDAIENNRWESIPKANRDSIEDVIAHGTGRFRTPGFKSKLGKDESATAIAIASASEILAASGLRPLERTMQGRFGFEGVSIDPKDWKKGRKQAEIESTVKKELSSNDQSILLHSRIAATAAATPAILSDISSPKFTFDPTPQGALGLVKPKPGFASLSTISDPPTSAEIAKARAFFRKGIPSYGGYLAGSVAIGIFQLAQLAGPAEVDSFAAEIRNTKVDTPEGTLGLSNWMDVNPSWSTFAWFIESWRSMRTTPPPRPKPPLPGIFEIFFHFDRPRRQSDTGLDVLTAEGRRNLDSLTQSLKSDPTLKVQLVGNCSSEGTVEHNYALGQRRAEFVAAQLGIGTQRLVDPQSEDLRSECHHIKAGVVSCGTAGAKTVPDPKDRRVLARFLR
jgi:peptidoglycan/xylan/chitin deacetylase (PgdA/CDA1 family)